MTARRPTTSAYALLGLLERAPAAGYELGVVAMRTIAHFWPLTRTHIYGELGRLEDLGYVTATEVAQENRPDKRVYRLTAAGTQALDAWLDDADLPPERNRIPLLVKLFFGHRMQPARRAALLARAREQAIAERDEFAAILDDLVLHHPEEIYSRATALYGLHQVEAALTWLGEVEVLLEGPAIKGQPRQPAT